jgi:hypothetical protein
VVSISETQAPNDSAADTTAQESEYSRKKKPENGYPGCAIPSYVTTRTGQSAKASENQQRMQPTQTETAGQE